ncbi:hypothetical protein J7J18_02545 [bacterium]|nr:hypothetical protein [bacterium]
MSTVVIAGSFSVAAGSEDSKTIYTVPGAKTFRIKRVQLHFPVGTEGHLAIQLVVENFPILPDEGEFTGDDVTFTVESEKEVPPNSEIKIKGVNSDSSNPHSVYYVVEGVLE